MQGIRIFMLCMMMRLTALMTYCWMACVLASCVGSASSDAIEVNLLHTDVDTIAYSAFVDSIEYIPLETTEECLVGEVTDVVMAGDRLFVFDAKQQEVVWGAEGKAPVNIFPLPSLNTTIGIACWLY